MQHTRAYSRAHQLDPLLLDTAAAGRNSPPECTFELFGQFGEGAVLGPRSIDMPLDTLDILQVRSDILILSLILLV